jgi:hypothetical protein
MVTPEQKQPTGIPIVRSMMMIANELRDACWPVTALLHEALHLPKFRKPAKAGLHFAVVSKRTKCQHAGSLTFARTKR